MAASDLNAELTERAIERWVERIKASMVRSVASFVMGHDYDAGEHEWIRTVLVSRLGQSPYNLYAETRTCAPTPGPCPCKHPFCEHVDGRIFLVSLKK